MVYLFQMLHFLFKNCLLAFTVIASTLFQARRYLMMMIDNWRQSDLSLKRCREWIQSTEEKLATVDFKTKLLEKQEQLQMIQVSRKSLSLKFSCCEVCLSFADFSILFTF